MTRKKKPTTPNAPRTVNLGELVREARQKAAISQEELATRTGTGQAAIARIEGNVRIPDVVTLENIAAALGLRLRVGFEPVKKPAG